MTLPTHVRDAVPIPLDRGSRSLRVSAAAMKELQSQIAAAALEPGRIAGEIGGFFLGTVGEREIAIEAVREIRTPQRYGIPFLLSEPERADARRMAVETPAPRRVVGFYRSHLREGDLLQREDVEFIAALPEISLIAILQPSSAAHSVCRVFIRAVHGVWAPAGAFSVPDLEPVAQQFLLPEPPPDRVPRRRSWVWWMIPAALAVLIAVVWWFSSGRRLRPAPVTAGLSSVAQSDSGLELRLERGATGDIKIMWSRQAPSILAASGGWLRIRDGATDRDLDLDPDQLRSGNLLYVGAGSDVVFRLEIFDRSGRLASESVRLVGGTAIAMSRPQPRPGVLGVPQQGNFDRTAPAGVRPGSAPPQQQQQQPAQAQPAPELEVPAPAPASVTASMPAPDSHSSAPGLAPPLVRAPSTSQTVAPPVAQLPTQPVKPPQQPPVQSVKPPQQSQLPVAPPPPRQQQPPPPDNIQPARAVRQFRPVVPPNIKALLNQDVTLTVTVVVDEKGKVVSATPSGAQGVVGRMLSAISVDAAKSFRFEPARRNGQPVSSNVALVFRFSR